MLAKDGKEPSEMAHGLYRCYRDGNEGVISWRISYRNPGENVGFAILPFPIDCPEPIRGYSHPGGYSYFGSANLDAGFIKAHPSDDYSTNTLLEYNYPIPNKWALYWVDGPDTKDLRTWFGTMTYDLKKK